MSYRCITYGYGSRYALIDGYTQRVWIMLGDEYLDILKKIQEIFFSKVQLLLVDISDLSNYAPDLIDNSVCLNWQIAGPDFEMLHDDVFSKHSSQKIFKFDNRYKFVKFDQPTMLPYDRALDLQHQMMLFHHITKFALPQNLAPGRKDKIINTISKSFMINLTTADIEHDLYSLETDIGTHLTILRAIGKLYE